MQQQTQQKNEEETPTLGLFSAFTGVTKDYIIFRYFY